MKQVSALLLLSLLLLQGYSTYAEGETDTDPKPANTNKPLTLGVPQTGTLSGKQKVVYEINGTSVGDLARYSVYIPNYSADNFKFSAYYVDELQGTPITDAREIIQGSDFIYQFKGKDGTYNFIIDHVVANEEDKTEHNYTIAVTKSSALNASKVLSTVGSELIKSYHLTVENVTAVLIKTALCSGQVALVVTDGTNKHFDTDKDGFIARTVEVATPMTELYIDVLQKTPVLNASEPSEFKLRTVLKPTGFTQVDNWVDVQKLLNFSNVTNTVEFEQAQNKSLAENQDINDFKITYKLVASISEKEVTRTLRCGLRANDKNSTVQTITLSNCTTKNCSAQVTKFGLPTSIVYLGLQGKVLNTKTNSTERVLYPETLTVYQVPEVTPGDKPSSRLVLYIVIGVAAVILIVGVLLWRRSKHITLKMEEEQLSSGAYKHLDM